MLSFGYNLGSVISLSTLQSTALERPYMPTFLQLINAIIWILNVQYQFISNFNLVFVWMMWIGCQ